MQVQEVKYRIGDKDFIPQDDFTYEELKWLNVVYERLKAKQNEITGSFTRDEISKTLKILLPGFTDLDFGKTRESLSVKIIADFFLKKAVLGAIIKSCWMN